MTGLYYAILALFTGTVYVLSVILKKNGCKIGTAICYAILFLIVLLFV